MLTVEPFPPPFRDSLGLRVENHDAINPNGRLEGETLADQLMYPYSSPFPILKLAHFFFPPSLFFSRLAV